MGCTLRLLPVFASALCLIAVKAGRHVLQEGEGQSLGAALAVERDVSNETFVGKLLEQLTVSPADGPRDNDFFRAFLKSLLMILVTEMGDETFIIAAIMAMRHSRLVVYLGAMGALTLMTVVSTALGYVLPNLISPTATHYAATVLYTIFGLRLLWIAWKSDPHAAKEEMEEVQQKVLSSEQTTNKWQQLFLRICTPVFYEALILTFLAEWGDRSQIATITLATSLNAYGVTAGAVLGHALCTGTAVLGGQLLAMKISQRTVALCGATLFLLFALNNLIRP